MTRSADYSIQGFLYQFNKTALEILKAQDDDNITVEGMVEDIEVSSPYSLTAIQCKYHEVNTAFTPSSIFKPLLQMLKHHCDNQTTDIHYILFAHYPAISSSDTIDYKILADSALASSDKELEKLIKGIPKTVDLDPFLSKFSIEFGPSFDELTNQVSKCLEDNGLPPENIETITYPNTIHMIATLSMKHNAADRTITKKNFLSKLKEIHTTTISRWTLALNTRKKLLDARRKQLKIHLDKNTQLRYFVVDPNSIEDYETEIVLFINDFLAKYHYKPAHINTPIMCVCSNHDGVLEIQSRLFAKNIVAEDGYIGGVFQETHFFREPLQSKTTRGTLRREFSLRLLSWEDHKDMLNRRKCDDLFILGTPKCDVLDTVDINVEYLSGANMKEIKYMMGVSDAYE